MKSGKPPKAIRKMKIDVKENVSLRPYNTFGVEAKAAKFAAISSPEQFQQAFLHLQKDEPLLIIGGGSNVLFTQDFPGLVLKNEINQFEVTRGDSSQVKIKIGAGENWHAIVRRTLKEGYFGLENLALIPGTSGAAPIQNIGAYGVEVSDRLLSVEYIELGGNSLAEKTCENCDFGYRDSWFKRHLGEFFITSISLLLHTDPQPVITYPALKAALGLKQIANPSPHDVAVTVEEIRRSKLPDPMVLGNAGSFFKNPILSDSNVDKLKADYPLLPFFPSAEGHSKIPAAWLIEQCGWKGFKDGNAGVHQHQPLVLVNHGGATGADIHALAKRIMDGVEDRFGIELTPEVNIL